MEIVRDKVGIFNGTLRGAPYRPAMVKMLLFLRFRPITRPGYSELSRPVNTSNDVVDNPVINRPRALELELVDSCVSVSSKICCIPICYLIS